MNPGGDPLSLCTSRMVHQVPRLLREQTRLPQQDPGRLADIVVPEVHWRREYGTGGCQEPHAFRRILLLSAHATVAPQLQLCNGRPSRVHLRLRS